MESRRFKRQINQLVEEAFERLVKTPGFWFKINSVSLTPFRSPLTGIPSTKVRVMISTNNRPLLLGQFRRFPTNGLRGYYTGYVVGFIHGHFSSTSDNKFPGNYELIFDVHEEGTSAEGGLYRYVPIEEALSMGVLGSGSPTHVMMEKYSLTHILMAGSTYSGPSLALMKEVERVARQPGVLSMLDVFCGTGCFSKVGRVQGIRSVVLVDDNISHECLRQNLGEYMDGCDIIETNAYDYCPDQVFDLVVLDPFYEFADDALRRLLPRLLGRFRILLVNLGPPEAGFWIAKLLRTIERHGLTTVTHTIAGESVGICTES